MKPPTLAEYSAIEADLRRPLTQSAIGADPSRRARDAQHSRLVDVADGPTSNADRKRRRQRKGTK